MRVARACALVFLLRSDALAQTIEIASPASGTQVQPGATVNVSVTSSTPSVWVQVAVIGEPPFNEIKTASAVPMTATFTIPSDAKLGQAQVVAIASTGPGSSTESEPVVIDVERSDTPLRLDASLPRLRLQVVGQQIPLKVLATFNGDVVLDATESTRVTFATTEPDIVSVDSTGVVTALRPGGGAIVATYAATGGNVTATVPVTIEPQKVQLSQNSVSFGEVVIGQSATASVVVTNTSAGPLSLFEPVVVGGFGIQNNCPSTPLAAGSTCSLTVSFQPTAVGEVVGSVELPNTFYPIPVVIRLQGTGRTP
jgi:hypothetical protein